MEANRTYFMRRAAQERSAASRSSDLNAREAHRKMAQRYQQLVSGESEDQPPAA